MAPLRWGIVGAGRISHDFVTAIQIFPEKHEVVAIGSKNKEKAEIFAKNKNILKAHEGYQGIVEDKEVDIVYVGNLNFQHYSTIKLMLEHGKHVLCETPFTINEKQSKELINLARSKKLFLMQAVWFPFLPAYQKARELIDNGVIGDVIYAEVSFGFGPQTKVMDMDRLTSKKMAGGATLEFGVYCLKFQKFAFHDLKIKKFVVNGYLKKDGVDGTSGTLISYENEKFGSITSSIDVRLLNEGAIIGTKGTLRFPNFWCCTKLITNEKTYDFELPKTNVEFNYYNSCGLAYEANAIKKYIENGAIESNEMPLDETKEFARLLDIWRKEIGLYFPEDE